MHHFLSACTLSVIFLDWTKKLYNIFIDRDAGEMIHLVTSIRPSIYLCLYAFMFTCSLVPEGRPVRMKCALSLSVFLKSRLPLGFRYTNFLQGTVVKIVEKVRAHFPHTGSGRGPTLV